MREYGLTLLVTAAITYLLTPLVRKAAFRFKVVIPARERDVHVGPIPRMGGLAMYLGVAAGLLAAYEMLPLRDAFAGSGLMLGLLGAGGVIVAVGIIDDRWGMNAIGKLAGQVVAAGILFASGAQLNSFPEPNNHLFGLTQNESVVLTILVVVATINAVNFIDGLDGLAAGVVFIAAISFFAYYYTLAKVVGLSAEAVPALASIVLAGACLGFLPHNFYPARIFMGDTGSMLLGLLLAYVPIWAISSLDYTSLASKANRFPEILPLLLPAAVLVIPYVDLLRAVFRRTKAGKSPFSPDNKHLHHRLLEIGHSHRSSVLILYAWALLFSGTVVGLSLVTAPLIVLAGITLAAVLVLALLSLPKLRWWERNRGPQAAAGGAVAGLGRAGTGEGFGRAGTGEGFGRAGTGDGYGRTAGADRYGADQARPAAQPDPTSPDIFRAGRADFSVAGHDMPGPRAADHGFAHPGDRRSADAGQPDGMTHPGAAARHQRPAAAPAGPDLTTPDLFGSALPAADTTRSGLFGGRAEGHGPAGPAGSGLADGGAPEPGGQAWQPKPEPRPWPWEPAPSWSGKTADEGQADPASPWPGTAAAPAEPPDRSLDAAMPLGKPAARASGNVIP